MTAAVCQRHGVPTRDAWVCRRCVRDLERHLAELPGLIGDLEIALTKQSVLAGAQVGSRNSEKPLPFDVGASKILKRLYGEILGWVRAVMTPGDRWPDAGAAAAVQWMHARLAEITPTQHAAGLLEAAVGWSAEILAEIDRRPERWYAGQCGALRLDGSRCAADVYADAGAQVVTCRACRHSEPAEARRVWLLDAAQDQLAHAELIGRAAPALGVDITPAAIRNYADRGRIVAHGLDRQGRPLYRVGDVIDVARDVLARREERRQHAKDRDGARRSA